MADLSTLVQGYVDAKSTALEGTERLPGPEVWDDLGGHLDAIGRLGTTEAIRFLLEELIGNQAAAPELATASVRALFASGRGYVTDLLLERVSLWGPAVRGEIFHQLESTERDLGPMSGALFELAEGVPPKQRSSLVVVFAKNLGSGPAAERLVDLVRRPQSLVETYLEGQYRSAILRSYTADNDRVRGWLGRRALARFVVEEEKLSLVTELAGVVLAKEARAQLERVARTGGVGLAAIAVEALGRIDIAPSMEAIGERLSGVTAADVSQIVKPRTKEDLSKIVETFKGDDVLLRLLALRSLRRVQGTAAIVAALGDADAHVSAAASRALVEMHTKAAVGPLITVLERNEDLKFRKRVFELLVHFTGRTLTEDARAWRKWWDTAEEKFELPKPGRKRITSVKHKDLRYFGIEVTGQRLMFLMDVSDSMSGERLRAAKDELTRILRSLPDAAAVNIVTFGSDAVAWKAGLARLGGTTRQEAVEYVLEQETSGGTNISDALEFALAHEKLEAIYLLSDGSPNAGAHRSAKAILKLVKRLKSSRNLTIHCIAFGRDSALLRVLAKGNGGSYRRVDEF